MRELKFRAWDKKSKKIRIVESIGFGELSYYNEGYPVANMIGRDCIHDKDIIIHRDSYQHELMQYTGLTDKNEKEIYEGDIVSMFHNTQYSEVKWNNEYGCWKIKVQLSIHSEGWDLLGNHIKQCKVIGNIYENPELLEGEK